MTDPTRDRLTRWRLVLGQDASADLASGNVGDPGAGIPGDSAPGVPLGADDQRRDHGDQAGQHHDQPAGADDG